MKLQKTPINDLFVIKRSIFTDERGSFTRLYGEDEIKAAGRQCSVVHTTLQHLNLLNYQNPFSIPPFSEENCILHCRCYLDVGVDLRPNSPTQFQWFGVELTPKMV